MELLVESTVRRKGKSRGRVDKIYTIEIQGEAVITARSIPMLVRVLGDKLPQMIRDAEADKRKKEEESAQSEATIKVEEVEIEEVEGPYFI